MGRNLKLLASWQLLGPAQHSAPTLPTDSQATLVRAIHFPPVNFAESRSAGGPSREDGDRVRGLRRRSSV